MFITRHISNLLGCGLFREFAGNKNNMLLVYAHFTKFFNELSACFDLVSRNKKIQTRTNAGTGCFSEQNVITSYSIHYTKLYDAIGKWHVGVKDPGQHPLDRGFDKYYGFNSAQTDYFNSPIMYDGRTKVTKHKYTTFQFIV